jgi:hypothetical protein
MNTIKLHHPTGHPYWQQNQFQIQINENFIDPYIFLHDSKKQACSKYEIFIGEHGIYVQYFHCSSGTGIKPISEVFLLVLKETYLKIEYVGTPLIPSGGAFYTINKNGHNY